MARLLALLLPLLSLATGSALARSVHTRDVPAGWTKSSRASADARIKLRLTLPSAAGEHALHSTLAAVSTPGSEAYGRHLSREEMGALVAPALETTAAVMDWLRDYDVGEVRSSAGGDVLTVATTVGKAEALLSPAEYWVFTSAADAGRTTLRTLSFGIPGALDGLVDSVHPTTLFPEPEKRERVQRALEKRALPLSTKTSGAPAPEVSASCANAFTPNCSRALYNLGDYKFTSTASNAVFVYAEGASSSKSDLKTYLKKYTPAYSSTTFSVVSAAGGEGGTAPSDYNVEATLDLDVIISLTAPTPVSLVDVPYSSDALDEPTQFLDFVDYVLNMTTPPTVTSFSYGMDEAQIFGDAAAAKVGKQLCNAYAQFGARGVSALVASGDSGTGGSNSKFKPDFPASCPYVTAVGATEDIPETTADFSGGGFSNVYGTASWQAAAVKTYLAALGSTDKGAYNASGRGYPDVAAFGVNWEIEYEGSLEGVAGTSASCPNVAAIITALNDYQLSQGKSALGFLNPWIYNTTAAAGGWNDITTGSNDADNNGFPAKAGWDPATGWGSPNFTKLKSLLP